MSKQNVMDIFFNRVRRNERRKNEKDGRTKERNKNLNIEITNTE